MMLYRRLSLYPNGCKERNGSGHISLYLRILETNTFPPDWEVYVNHRLFVFDQKRDNYLTVQGYTDIYEYICTCHSHSAFKYIMFIFINLF